MTMRIWTKDELDLIWPIAKYGFQWVDLAGEGWMALGTQMHRPGCWVSSVIEVMGVDDGVPPEVALAVASVHLGRDSSEWIATKLEERAKMATSEANAQPDHGRMLECEGQAHAWKDSAEMVRRGTVKP